MTDELSYSLKYLNFATTVIQYSSEFRDQIIITNIEINR